MPYLLDSDWLIDYLAQEEEAISLFGVLAEEPLYISIITYLEVYQGTLRTEDPAAALADLRNFLDAAILLPISESVAERCARLRQDIQDQGKRPGRRALDLLIAATALEHDLTLVTRNTRDYSDIRQLRLY
jgi:predicted nucleic acid-binding protein